MLLQTSDTLQMNSYFEDTLRQRKLLLWRKILETFPIERKLQEKVLATIFPQQQQQPPPPVPSNAHTPQQPQEKD